MNSKTTRRQFIKKTAHAGVFLGLTGNALMSKGCSTKKEYDILISGAIVFDGAGNPGKDMDVALKGDKIIAIGSNLRKEKASIVIEAGDLAVAPGFIDAHSHTDYLLLINPKAESKIRQGVTTDIGGNCGGSLFPLSDSEFEEQKILLKNEYDFDLTWRDLPRFFNKLREKGMALNFATLVGHGTIRSAIIGPEDRTPSDNELNLMKKAVRDNIKAGAVGMSTGLFYAPGSFARKEEIIELCRELAPSRSVYASHIRDEGDFLIESIDEAISIAKEAQVSLQISHLKAQYPRNYSKIHTALSKIEEAHKEGVSILADRYPYHASSTSLSSFFPRWSQQGTTDDFLTLLQDKTVEQKILAHIKKQEEKIQSWENVIISSVLTEKNKHLEGKSILQGSTEAQKPCYEFIRNLLIEENNQVAMINFSMSEDNLRLILAHPHVVIGSDGNALAPYGVLGKGKPHPRSYGTFVRVLGKYSREEKILTLPQAIQKMTSLTAQKFGLAQRGLIKEGYFADLVIFNPEKVIDKADWLNPHQYPAGIEYVIVNGQVVINRGEHTGLLPGRILRNEAV